MLSTTGQTDRTRHRASMVQISDRPPLPALCLYLLPGLVPAVRTVFHAVSFRIWHSHPEGCFPLGRCIADLSRQTLRTCHVPQTNLPHVSVNWTWIIFFFFSLFQPHTSFDLCFLSDYLHCYCTSFWFELSGFLHQINQACWQSLGCVLGLLRCHPWYQFLHLALEVPYPIRLFLSLNVFP